MTTSAEILRAISRRSPFPARRPPGAGDRSKDVAALKVLVVEDESIIGWALRDLLEDMGHEVVEIVSSGTAAVAAAAEHQPQLVFMDINLGRGMNGIEAAELIASQGPARTIFVSAYGDGDTAASIARRVPGSPLLAKPVSLLSIEAAIARLFARRH